jgi:hypothetical protein
VEVREPCEDPAAASGMWEAVMEVRLRALHVQAVRAVQEIRVSRAVGALRAARCAVSVVIMLIWCWALFRVAVQPATSGPIEQGMAIGGWTLSLLPVHVAPRRPARRGPVGVNSRMAAAVLPTPRIPARGRPLAGAVPVSRPDKA